MLIKLVGNINGKNRLFKLSLPEIVEGNYWLCNNYSDEEEKLINIKSYKGRWILKSNKYFKIIDKNYVEKTNDGFYVVPSNKAIIDEIDLKEYGKYYISIKNSEKLFVLYSLPSYERDVRSYKFIDNYEVTIGSGEKNDIIVNNRLFENMHARIFLKNGKWHVENYDRILGIFLNDRYVENIEKIEYGDIIFISGIKFMILDNNLIIFAGSNSINQISSNLLKIVHNKTIIDKERINDNIDDEIELYSENDYFHLAPRIMDKIEKENVSIDQPPKKEGKADSSQFLSLFSTMSMSIVTVLSLVLTISAMQNGNTNKTQIMIRIITSAIMLISMLVIPIIRLIIQKRSKKKKEFVRQREYKKYINSKIIQINEIMDKQTKILKQNNMIAEQCERVILEKSHELWERQINDEDFLNINLGNGNKTLDIGLDKSDPKFSLEKDNLLDIYYDIVNKSRVLEGVPITVSLTEKNILSLISNQENNRKEYIENIILQLIAFQNYRNLKLVFFIKNEQDWQFVKFLPHIWDDSNTVRFFATNRNDIKEISQYLEQIINERSSTDDNGTITISSKRKDYKDFDSYYVIITDNYKNLHNIGIINRVLGSEENFGFSLMCITNDITQLPNQCKLFVELRDKKITVFENKNSSSSKKEITTDEFEKFDYSKISKVMSNIPIKYTSVKAATLPKNYNFLEMYNSGNIEQLNIFERWNENDSTMSLQAQVGIDATGNPIYLDAHEKYHGPHGLIAGTTGSGKSEFIITYILSLAINYHPDDVTFVLIDYKGGGLAGAFKKKNIQLPHLVGTITNIDSVGLQRSLESIQSELRRRQIMFNEAKNITNESTIDIYKYQKFYHEGVLKEPISHLFIICDEFAELKQQQPDFMAELMSVSRIGRSLGVHLILATQKPAGIVNDQIRSNSKFGVCLKVQDKSDSKDIIKKPDAATLKNAGQFYINVGNDEYFALGQSAYTGVSYIPSDVVRKDKNNSTEFISNIGSVIRRIEPKKTVVEVQKNNGDQLTNIIRYLAGLSKKKNIQEKQLWLDAIPENIFIKDLRKKYNVISQPNLINPIIGEYDDPFNQLQNVLRLNLSEDGNTVIYGSSDSGKEMVLEAVLYDTMICHSSEEVQFYLMDFGSETLRNFRKAPHVRDVVLSEDSEKIMRLFKLLKHELKIRKEKLIDYNGNYKLFLENSGEKMPMIVIILNDYGSFLQNYQKYDDEIIAITKECNKYGIVFIITGNAINELRLKLVQNFKRKLTLQLITEDYSFVFNKAKKKKPSSLYGRGLTTVDDDTVYEFQTARICSQEKLNNFIKLFVEKLRKNNTLIAPAIPVIPKTLLVKNVADEMKDLSNVPIGMSAKNVRTYIYNFAENIVNIITSKNIELCAKFVEQLIKLFNLTNNVEAVLIDEERLIDKSRCSFINKFNAITERLNQNLVKKEEKQLVYIILGIDNFMNKLGDEKELFTLNLNSAKSAMNCKFIVVDTAVKIKSHQFESWYKNYVTPGNGIYLGDGFDSQFALTYEADRKDIDSKCGDSYGYAINKNKPTLIKLIGIEEKGEDDE